MRKIGQKDITELYTAILELRDVGEARGFFRDLLTPTEIEELAERFLRRRFDGGRGRCMRELVACCSILTNA